MVFFGKSKRTNSSAAVDSTLYVNASEFINYIHKDQISGPVSARPMGAMDITACDVICRGIPSPAEIKLLRRYVRKTATALGIRANRNIEMSIAV
ncbi:hypothetical protein GGI15_001579 [Coemansia interrupta]|uniref:Uncharacterized protein n=1 Tax=Coemansia interrupta TaxID=1126814 RepID=A0A9W8HP20_9FUNG|nr:hypothetical protein GGI15_001579 [Coemansia interrupta]